MVTISRDTPVDDRDVQDAKRLFVRAFRRRPHADAMDVTMSVAFASIYVTMNGLSQALPADQVRSLMAQFVDQAEAQIAKKRGR